MTPEASEVPPSPETLAALYERGRFHEGDGYYGILEESEPQIIAALQVDPSLHNLVSLSERFPMQLRRFDPANSTEVYHLTKFFPGAKVICIIRGEVDRVTSMLAYGQDSGVYLPLETTMPNGC